MGSSYKGAAEEDRTIPLKSAREAMTMVFREKYTIVVEIEGKDI